VRSGRNVSSAACSEVGAPVAVTGLDKSPDDDPDKLCLVFLNARAPSLNVRVRWFGAKARRFVSALTGFRVSGQVSRRQHQTGVDPIRTGGAACEGRCGGSSRVCGTVTAVTE
jgi:hypothetical protein